MNWVIRTPGFPRRGALIRRGLDGMPRAAKRGLLKQLDREWVRAEAVRS